MSIYGAQLKERIIALHEDPDIVWEFIFQQQDKNVSFVKFKKKYVKTLEETGELHDLYLIKICGKHVPRCVVGMLENDEYEYCVGVVSNILENEDLDKDDIKILKKAIKIIRKLSCEQSADSMNISEALKTSVELKEYDEMFRQKAFTE